jgi:hypothetical protein
VKASLTELEGGAVRVTLPLPWALDHVHCYALPGPEGWTIVDAGLGDPPTLAAWPAALAQLGGPVHRLVITHYHPDHLGASGELVTMSGAEEVVQGALDAELAERAWVEADPEGFRSYLERHGMPAEMAARSADAEQGLPIRLARPTRLVQAGVSWESETSGGRCICSRVTPTATSRSSAGAQGGSWAGTCCWLRSPPTSAAGRTPRRTRLARTWARWTPWTRWPPRACCLVMAR